eukprot:g19744.t1
MKAANLQTGQEQSILSPSEQLESLSAPVGSLLPSLVKATSELEMDTADDADLTPLPPEEENEFLPRCSRHKRLAESEELDLVQKHPRKGYKKKNRPTFVDSEREGCSDCNEVSWVDLCPWKAQWLLILIEWPLGDK